MNKRVKDSFLLLLRMGLWGAGKEHLSIFPLSKSEWTLVYEVSLSQTVEGIVYEGMLLLPNEYYPPYEILLRWTAKIDSIERYNKKVRNTLAKLTQGFSKSNIQYVLLKGIGLAENYEKPLLRVSGDIDLCFRDKEAYDTANSLLKSKGYNINKGDHHSVFYTFNSIEVEHHTNMIDIFNPFKQQFIKELIIDEEKYSKSIVIEGQCVHIPSYTLNHVQANAHILKHYIGFGIGLRQICVIARLCNVKEESFDGQKLKNIYAKLGMKKWMNVMHNLLVKDLGLDSSRLPYPLDSDYNTSSILNDILHSGNFGFHDVRYREVDAPLSERYYKRDKAYKRILPHLVKLIRLIPSEVFWYPLNKYLSRLTNN